MASLEGQISVYNAWIEKKEAEINDLRSQKRQLQDAEKKKELEQDIQKLVDERDKLMGNLAKLEDALLGTFRCISIQHQHPHSQPTTRCLLHVSRLFAQFAWRTAGTAVATQ